MIKAEEVSNMSHEPVLCPRCGQKAVEGAAYCPFCGTPLPRSAGTLSPEGQSLLAQAESTSDPLKKRELLLQARAVCPDSLEVEEALLFLGRLYERSPRKVDFSVIKCYLWHMYLKPEAFSIEKRQEMRNELFHDPQLERCLSLAPDPALFLRQYLERLAAEFVNLFLKGSNRYTNAIFGIRLDSRMEKVLAPHVADMLQRIQNDGRLEDEQRELLYLALYRAFLSETGGNPAWLNAQLTKRGLPVSGRA